MFSKVKFSALTFLFALALALTAQAPAQAASCTQTPIVEILTVEPDRIQVRFDERCTGEEVSMLWARGLSGGWSRLITNFGEATGWRSAWDEDLEPGHEYCYEADNRKDGITKTSARVCATTPLPKVKLGTIKSTSGSNLTSCSSIPASPIESELREHVFITDALAAELGITVPTGNGPRPQIRLTVDSPLMGNGLKSSVNYTVARTCPGTGPFDWRLWMWNAGKLFLPGTSLSNMSVTLQTVAPSRTTWTDNNSAPVVENHFTEPNANATGQRFFREKVAMVDNKEVALLVPHGGGIERNTGVQAQAFISEIGAANVNSWENEGQWGDEQTVARWHITAPDIHESSFPGLARLLAEPEFNDVQNQDFRYAVALHGFDDESGVGVILGGLAPADVLCHVARTIQDEAGARANEIGFHIANAGTSGADIRRANGLGYTPSPPDLQYLEGTSETNIVNRLSRGQAAWGGIQLEQSLPLRREMAYDFADANNDNVNDFCTNNESNCLHNIVARGVARAVAELVDDANPVNPTGACCTHFGERCQ